MTQTNPSDALAQARAHFDAGDPSQAAQALPALMALEHPPLGVWHLGALCAETLGDLESLPQLIQCSHDQGVVDADLMVRLSCYAGEPTAQGDGDPWLLAVASGGVLTLDVEPASDPVMLVSNLLACGQEGIVERLLSPRAQSLAPEWVTQAQSAAEALSWEAPDTRQDWIFIGGCPRSGTTLLRAMLHAHSRIYAGPETKVFRDLANIRDRWDRAPAHQAGVSSEMLDRAAAAFSNQLLSEWGQGFPRVAEKTPGNLLHMTSLARIHPRARFIHIIRDGRAVVNSLMKVNWSNPTTGKSLWYCESVGKAAAYWAANIQQIRAQSPGPKRYLELRYEDLVSNPEGAMRTVLGWLNEPWDPAVLAHHLAPQELPEMETSSSDVAQPVHTQANSVWQQTLDAQDLAEIHDGPAGKMLVELGYKQATPRGQVSLESLGLGF